MIKKIFFGIVIIFAILVAVQMSVAVECDTKGNYQVCWEPISEKSSKKIYELNISNLIGGPQTFNVEAYFADANTDAKFNLYEEVAVTYSHDFTERTCNIIGTFGNGSDDLSCSESTETRYYTETEWLPVNALPQVVTSKLVSGYETLDTGQTFGNVLIPPNKIKTYRIELYDFGSLFHYGTLGVRDLNTGLEYHPPINATFYSADFTLDNASGLPMITAPTVLNSSNFLFTSRGLMRYYTFDKTNITGDTVLNVMPSGGSVAWNGGPTVNVTAIVNEGFLLDGSDDFSNEVSLDTFNTTTIIIWINSSGVNNFFEGILYNLGGAQFTGMHFTTGGEMQAGLPGDGCAAVSPTIAINTSSALMITYTYDINNVSRLYFNDTQVGNNTGDCDLTTFRVRWGSDQCCGGRKYAGLIDDTYQFNESLIQAEISELWSSGTGVPYPLFRNDTFPSLTFHTGQANNEVTPEFSCVGTDAICTMNLTLEGVLFPNVTSGAVINITSPADNNLSFNYTVEVLADSAFTDLNISFESVTPPEISNFTFLANVTNETSVNFSLIISDTSSTSLAVNYSLFVNQIFSSVKNKNFSFSETTNTPDDAFNDQNSRSQNDFFGVLLEAKQDLWLTAFIGAFGTVTKPNLCRVIDASTNNSFQNISFTASTNLKVNVTPNLFFKTGSQFRIECTNDGGVWQSTGAVAPVTIPDDLTTVIYQNGSFNLDNTGAYYEVNQVFTSSVGILQTGIIINDSDGFAPVWNPSDNLTIEVSVSDSQFLVAENFTITVAAANISAPPSIGIGNFTCLTFDDICKDGKFKCLLAVNNATGEELESRDAFDVTCVSLNTDNIGLRFLFFAIIFTLIIIGIFFKIPAIGMIGSIAGVIVSIGLFWQFPLISVVLIFIFGAITFVQVLMIK